MRTPEVEAVASPVRAANTAKVQRCSAAALKSRRSQAGRMPLHGSPLSVPNAADQLGSSGKGARRAIKRADLIRRRLGRFFVNLEPS